MTRLLQTRDQLVYPPEVVAQESSWAYIQSFSQRPFNSRDNDAPNYRITGASIQGQHPGHPASQLGGGAGQGFPFESRNQGSSHGLGNRNRKEPIDRFASIIDAEDPRFEKQRMENHKVWENNVNGICNSLNRSMDAFYSRKTKLYHYVVSNTISERDSLVPIVDINEGADQMQEMALAPWIFQSLPGTKPSQWEKSPSQLDSLVQRLDQLPPASLWNEPLELTCGGPEFFEQARDYLFNTGEKLNQIDILEQANSDHQELITKESNALVALFGVSAHMANYEKLIYTLEAAHELSKQCKHTDSVIERAQPHLKKYLQQIVDFAENQKSLHYFQQNSINGVIAIAKHFSMVNLNENFCSLTTCGKYLYLLISATGRGQMYKIGSGENGSLAGKVYLSDKAEKEGEMTWVYCQGKLYTRRANEELGTISVIDADTLKSQGIAKLYFGDQYQNPTAQSLNRYYPLLTDGKNLFAVTMNIVSKRRKVKDNMRKLYQTFQEHKRKAKEEEEKQKQLAASAKQEKDKSLPASLSSSSLSDSELKALIQAGDAKSAQLYLSMVEKEAIKELSLAMESPNVKKMTEKERQSHHKQLRHNLKQKLKNAKREFQKLSLIAQQERDKDQKKPPAPPGSADKKVEQDPDMYRVCEFWVHEFDIDGQGQEEIPLQQLLENDLVIETFNSFSGFFTYEECYRALKFHNDDIAEAVAWLVDEGEKERGKKSLQRKRALLLVESEVESETTSATKKNEVDVIVYTESILKPQCISTGKWTINDNQISYHHPQNDQGYINVFSLKQEDQRVINEQDIEQKLLENPQNPQLEKLNDPAFANSQWNINLNDVNSEVNSSAGKASNSSAKAAEESQAEKSEVQSQKSDSVMSSQVSETIEITLSEEDLYEEIRLYGTFIKKIKMHRSSDFNQNVYITYDHSNRQFYMLMTGGNMRYIAVSQDLHQMNSLLTEVVINLDTDLQYEDGLEEQSTLKKSDEKVGQQRNQNAFTKIQDLNSQEQTKRKRKGIDQLLQAEMKSVSDFMLKVLAVLKHVSKKRHSMPWRWRPWSFVYSEAITSWINSVDQSEDEEDSRKQIEQRKKQEAKLNTRLDKVTAEEILETRERLGIQYEEPQSKLKPSQIQRTSTANDYKLGKRKDSVNVQPVAGKKQPPLEKPRDGASNWNTFEYSNNPFPNKKPAEHAPKVESPPEQVISKERLLNQVEVKKLYAFQTSGSVTTLRLLVRLMKDPATSEGQKDRIISQILDWITYADVLVNLHHPSYVDELRELIIHFLTEKKEATTQIRETLLWKCLLLGWPIFSKNTQVLHQLFSLVLQGSKSWTERMEKLPFSREKNKIQSLPSADNSFTYYQIVQGINNLSPLQLFRIMYHTYPVSFFNQQVLLQTIVKTFALMVPNSEQPENAKIATAIVPSHQNHGNLFGSNNSAQATTITSRKVIDIFKDTFLRPRYDSFYQNNSNVNSHINESISIKNCKTIYQNEIEIGTIHQHFFNVPSFLLFCNQFEVVENVYGYKSTLPFDKLIRYYSDEKPLINEDDSDEVKHQKKLEKLHEVRDTHDRQSQELLNKVQDEILGYIQRDEQSDTESDYIFTLMRVYINLMRLNLDQIDYSSSKETKYSVSALKFLDKCYSTFMKKTVLQNQEPSVDQIVWLQHVLELTSTTTNIIYDVVNFENQACFCKEAAHYLLKIIESIKMLYAIPHDTQAANSGSQSALKFKSLLEMAYVFLSEGTDFTYEKVFETSHPYPKIESLQKDQVHCSNAIAFSIEFDKRCQTETNNDSLTIYSQDHAYWINDTFGTMVKFYGKYQSKYPVLILGNRINIEFRSFMQKKQPTRGGRGGYYMSSGAPAGPGDDPQARWGYKVHIRPIYDEPNFFLVQNSKTEKLKIIQRRLGGESKVNNIISLMNQLYYTASKFTRSVIQARDIPQWLTYYTQNENSLAMQSNAQMSLVEPFESTLGYIQQSLQLSQDQLKRYLGWHLFKGGLSTGLVDSLHIPEAVDQFLDEELRREEALCYQAYVELEKYIPPQRAIEQEEVKEGDKLERAPSEAKSELMKEGSKIKVIEFAPHKQYWTEEVIRILEDKTLLEKLIKKVRELVPYSLVFNNEKRKPSFKKQYQEDWQLFEQQTIVAMLYHSQSLGEVIAYLGGINNGKDSQSPNKTNPQTQALTSGIQEKLTLIGTQLNDILSWMQSRLQGEQDFQTMLKDVVAHTQSHMDKVIAKKQQELEERLRLQREKEEEERIKQLAAKQAAEKLQNEEEKKEQPSQKKSAVVSKSKPVKHAKRKNVVKIAAPKVDLTKIQKEKTIKEQEKALKKKAKVEGAEDQNVLHEIEDKKEDIQPASEQEAATQKIKYLELPKAEENDIKNKIYNKVYEDFLQFYQGNQDRVKPLCLLLNIQFNAEDPNESLRAIFKRVKQKLQTLIDFDGDMALRESITIEELNLESPYQEIRKDVQQRILFLFEMRPSMDYHTKVVKMDAKQAQRRFQLHTHTLSQLSDQDQYNDTDSQNPFGENSAQGDDDSELLEPLGLQRSQSVQVGVQPPLQGISGASQAVIAEQNRMKDAEIANWIDNYRKWRQWNRQHNLIHKQHGAVGDAFLEEDLTSPFCSPLFSIVSFAKSSKITDSNRLREVFVNHQVKAAFRAAGLKLEEKLLSLSQFTPFQRLSWGNLSITLKEGDVMGDIESAGEKLAQSINENSRQLMKQLMKVVIYSQKFIYQYIYKRRSSSYSSSHRQQQTQQTSSKAQNTNSSSESKSASPQQQQQRQTSTSRQSSSGSNKQSFDEWIIYEQFRRLISTLNDIRLLLNNVYTREYILESVRKTHSSKLREDMALSKSPNRKERIGAGAHHQTSTDLNSKVVRDTSQEESKTLNDNYRAERKDELELDFESLQKFLKSIISLMQYTSSSTQSIKSQSTSSTKLQFQVTNCCKLILSQLMNDKSMMRSTETQKLIQEMLLDIVVSELEQQCGIKVVKASSQSQNEVGEKSAEKLNDDKSKVEKTLVDASQKIDLQRIVNKINSISFSDEIVSLLKTLSEVIRISDDHSHFKQDMLQQTNTSDQESVKEGYFLSEGSDKVMRCAQILAFLMHNTEIPIVMRQTQKCARLFFKLVDFKKLTLHYPTANKFLSDQSSDPESQGRDIIPNQFLIETLLKIGQKVSNTTFPLQIDQAESSQQKTEEVKGEEKVVSQTTEDSKEKESQIETSVKAVEGSDQAIEVQNAAQPEKLYVVYGNVNSSEEDYSFLITALYHWEELHPVITTYLPTDPAEIRVKSKPKPKEEEKKDAAAAAGEVKEEVKDKASEDKVEAPGAKSFKELLLEKEKEKRAIIEKALEDGVQHEPIGQKLLEQILSEDASSSDIFDLINLQRQQQEIGRGGRGGRGAARGGGLFGSGRGGARGGAQVSSYNSYEEFKMSRQGYQFGQPAPKAPSQAYYSSSVQMMSNTLSIFKVDQTFQEIVKATHEDCKEEDSAEEQMRKLNECNYNARVQSHIKDALSIAALLHHRYSAPICEPMPLQKAIEFSNIMKQAYNGQLPPVNINPYLKAEFKEKKLSNQKSVSECFPLMVSKIEPPKKGKDLPPGAGAPIVIAPKQFVASIAEVRVTQKYETIVETKSSSLKALDKNPTDGFACNVISQSIRRQGASISMIIQQHITLLRSLITKQKKGSHRVHSNPQAKHSFITAGDKFNKRESLQKLKKQEQVFGEEMVEVLNYVLSLLSSKKWEDLQTLEKQLAFGILTVVGGWFAPYRSGQSVQVEINNQWVDAIVVDEGLGKKKLSVILEDDDTLQVQKVSTTKARVNQKYEWPFKGGLTMRINQELLSQSVIQVFRQLQTSEIHSKLRGDDLSHGDDMSLIREEGARIELADERFLLLQLLKVTSQIPWRSSSFVSQDKRREFVKLLAEISNMETNSVEKSQAYLEKQLIDSWERLIDKDEIRNNDFFVLREMSKINFFSQKSKKEDSKEEAKEAQKKISETEKLDLTKKLSAFKQELKNQFIDTEYVQPLSSYLKGLPEPIPQKNQSEAALKLLAHWEKHVIPKIVEFVRTTYKSWEMEFYFEQLRHHLRNGDQMRAIEDAMTMCERKLPQGCVIPDDNHDWTAKMSDECIVDSWALAKIKNSRQLNLANSSGQAAAGGGPVGLGDTSYPLLNKLINLGIDEFVILIKAVDNRANVILAECQDPDTMQVHSIWIPISHLSDLQTQLPPRSVGYSIQTLKKSFESSSSLIEKVYAKQTLIKYFESTLRQQEEQEELIQLQEIISWCVQEKYCESPVDGWMQELTCAIPLTQLNQQDQAVSKPESISDPVESETSEQIKTDQETQNDNSSNLQSIVQSISDQLAMENLIQSTASSDSNQSNSSQQRDENTLILIKSLIEQKLLAINNAAQDAKIEEQSEYKQIQAILDWCSQNWSKLADNIRENRLALDLCKQYDKYMNSTLKQLSEGTCSQLMPLHSLMPADDMTIQSQAAAILIMFKKSAVQLTPTSKIQFYSDPDKVNLVAEISTGQEGKKDLPPLLLNHGQIWVSIDSGTTALLPKHMQMELTLSLPCAIVVIPKSWTVCCWLTETLSNSILTTLKNRSDFAIDSYSRMISVLSMFYLNAKAPSMLKSLVFNILTRLLRKLRHIYRSQQATEEQRDVLATHLSKLFVEKEFIEMLLSELLLCKEQEEQVALREGMQSQSILYPAFVQDSVELLITIMLPTQKGKRIASYKDLIEGSITLPDWLQPLIKVAYFMHYFQSEMPLTLDLLKEIYEHTRIAPQSSLDQIIVIQGIPTDEEKYPKKWIRERMSEIIAKHGGRVLNPCTDITFPSKDTAVLLIDGFNNMTFVNDEDGKLAAIVDSDVEEEEKDDGANMGAKKIEEKKEDPPAMPTEYSCAICTYLNPVSAASCEICATPRPPMEQIIAEFQSMLNSASNNKPAGAEGNQGSNQEDGKEQEEQLKSPALVRMEHLAAELTLLIKREERRVIKERKQKEEEERKAKEAEEKERARKEKEEKDKKEKAEKEERERKLKEQKQKEEEEKKKAGKNNKASQKAAQRDEKQQQNDNKQESSKRDKKGKKQRQQDQQRQSPSKPRESGQFFAIQQVIQNELDLELKMLESQILQQPQLAHQEDYRLATELSSSHPSQPSNNLVTQLNIESIPDSHNDNSFEGFPLESNEDEAAWGEADQNMSSEQRRERTRQRLVEMGMDQQMLEQDPDLLEALLESMMAEEQIARQRAAEMRQEEEERRKRQQAEEEKKKKKEEEELKRKEMGEEAYQALKPKYTKLKVMVGGRNVIFEDIESSRLVFNFLRNRLTPKQAQESQEFEFSETLKSILTAIHKNFSQYPAEDLAALPTSLEDFELTAATIREQSAEEFIEQCKMIVEADVKLFMLMLESQGYDFWFQQVSYPTYLVAQICDQKVRNIQIFEKLKTFIEIDMCRETKGVQTLNPCDLRLISKVPKDMLINPENKDEVANPVNYYDDQQISNSYPEINEKLSIADVRYLWALLKTFNRYLAPAVPYINTSSYSSAQSGHSQGGIPSNSVPLTLAAYMSFSRNLCLMNVKFDLRHLILEKTSVAREQQQSQVPKVYFERLKLAHKNVGFEDAQLGSIQEDRISPQRGQERDSNHASAQSDAAKNKDKRLSMDFMFMQAYEQIKEMDLAQLRPKKPSGAEPHLSFHVIFRGEHVVGEAGPYRQFFADISQELQPNNLTNNPNQKLLGLLYPSPNNRAGSNIGKSKFVLSPSRNSSQDLSLFEFLGALMGVCIRTGAHLNLDLPQFVWKQLVGEKVSHEDLVEIDLGFYKLLSFMLSAPKKLYEESIFETWNALTLSDETVVALNPPPKRANHNLEELKNDGGQTDANQLAQANQDSNDQEVKVEYEDRVEYVKQALRARLTECSLQCEAIKRGIIKIVPEALLNMVTYQEFETWVCGKNIVDVDLLKRHTKYGGDKKTTILNEESRRIKWFWEVLREFSEEDKQKFIKFCWGQQRLPANDEEFERRQVRFMIKPSMKNTHGDGALPKADTCFFNLELPDYSSKEIMKQRILLAIYTDSDSMNAEAEHAANLHLSDPMGGAAAQRAMMERNLDQSYDDEY